MHNLQQGIHQFVNHTITNKALNEWDHALPFLNLGRVSNKRTIGTLYPQHLKAEFAETTTNLILLFTPETTHAFESVIDLFTNHIKHINKNISSGFLIKRRKQERSNMHTRFGQTNQTSDYQTHIQDHKLYFETPTCISAWLMEI